MSRFTAHRRLTRRAGRKPTRGGSRRPVGMEHLESRLALSAVPYNATALDTGEFMLGDITVTVVFFESVGSDNTETWTNQHRTEVKGKIEEALQWWEDTLALQSSVHTLNFEIDYTYADNPIEVNVEPISNRADDLEAWVGPFLSEVGVSRSGIVENDVRQFNHTQRVANDTNWAFTIFVINSDNDADDLFPSNSSVRGAFSLAGGSFLAVPSGRPASTIAHEISHQFWAMDEYASTSSTYDSTRGYYDTQNTNAVTGNPDVNSRESTLLGNQTELAAAYAAHTSSTSSLESIGWKDSDGDGLFDVFDVPIAFSAESSFNAETSQLRITGLGEIGVLPNQNSWGQQTSVTINRLDRVEIRVDGGEWQTAQVIDDYTVTLDLTLTMPDSGMHVVEVRLVDATGLITSDIFTASTAHIDSSIVDGFSGYLSYDANGNGVHDQGEQGLAGWTVELVNNQGQAVATQVYVEPDNYYNTETLSNPINGVTLRVLGDDLPEGYDLAATITSSLASTGTLGFGNYNNGSWSNLWSYERQLEITFDSPVSRVAIDAIASANGDIGYLELYDANDNLLARYSTSAMSAGEVETMVVEIETANAAYAIARGALSPTTNDRSRTAKYIGLDNLVVGRPNTTKTDAFGAFSLPVDVDGNYRLMVTPAGGEESFYAIPAEMNVVLGGASATSRLAFSTTIASTSWHNPIAQGDINGDGEVDLNDLDLLLDEFRTPSTGTIVSRSVRELTDAHQSSDLYLDIVADGYLDNRDLIRLLNILSSQQSSDASFDGESTQIHISARSSSQSNSSTGGGNIVVESEPGITFDSEIASDFAASSSTMIVLNPQLSSSASTSIGAGEGQLIEAAQPTGGIIPQTTLSLDQLLAYSEDAASDAEASFDDDAVDTLLADLDVAWALEDDFN
ncbi:hypothetical protein AB1L30_14490 [Bremerella sp. JC817]|uniref:hypothetical protein n=1 Tax=Bremerella sp. JC817 TaxID=3231756 RepID=UPI00345B0292